MVLAKFLHILLRKSYNRNEDGFKVFGTLPSRDAQPAKEEVLMNAILSNSTNTSAETNVLYI